MYLFLVFKLYKQVFIVNINFHHHLQVIVSESSNLQYISLNIYNKGF